MPHARLQQNRTFIKTMKMQCKETAEQTGLKTKNLLDVEREIEMQIYPALSGLHKYVFPFEINIIQ